MVRFFLAKPVKGELFRTLIVIHEIFGLTNFIRNVARRFAYEGYLAMAPSLPTGTLPDGKHSEWMLETLQTGVAVVDQPEIDMLNDGYRYLLTRDEVDTDHIGSIGFCWGGARSFSLATRNNQLWAAIVCYGSTPPLQDLDNIKAPVIGLYAALDNNSPTSITGRAAETAREMHARGKVFEWEVYDLAAHGFFRAPDGESISQERPAVLGWALLKDFLDRYYPRG